MEILQVKNRISREKQELPTKIISLSFLELAHLYLHIYTFLLGACTFILNKKEKIVADNVCLLDSLQATRPRISPEIDQELNYS